MALRFRRSVRLAPGIRMNFSGSGVSWTLGPRGASIGFGRRGTYLNTGIPGTGLYARQRVSSSPPATRPEPLVGRRKVTITVSDEGEVQFLDEGGGRLSDEWIALGKKQHGDLIKGLVQSKVDEINASVEALGEVHLSTPPPLAPKYAKAPFEHARPSQPAPRPVGFWARLFRRRRERIEAENAAAEADYQQRLAAWAKARGLHEQLEEQRRKLVEEDVLHDRDAMERVLAEAFEDIAWPRETVISFDVAEDGRAVTLDVDLPEIEDMPTKIAAVTGRGFEVKFTEASATKVRQLYMRHVHAVGFRLIGEVFACLPGCETVTLSAFSQRPDRQTGQIADQYLYSTRVARQRWRDIDFTNLDEVDVVAALERFEFRRTMTKTGVFQPIEPFE
jgi:hypothetical protein